MAYVKYICSQGDVLDAVSYRFYGTETMTETVLEANPGLASYGTVLPQGLLIKMPVIDAMADRVSGQVDLWQ